MTEKCQQVGAFSLMSVVLKFLPVLMSSWPPFSIILASFIRLDNPAPYKNLSIGLFINTDFSWRPRSGLMYTRRDNDWK